MEALRIIFGFISAYGAYSRQRDADAEQLRLGNCRNKTKILVTVLALLGIVLAGVAIVIPLAQSDWGRRPVLLTIFFVAGILTAMLSLGTLLKRWPDYLPIKKDLRM